MDLTDIDYHSYCFGTIGRGVCVSMYGLIVLLYDLYIVPNFVAILYENES